MSPAIKKAAKGRREVFLHGNMKGADAFLCVRNAQGSVGFVCREGKWLQEREGLRVKEMPGVVHESLSTRLFRQIKETGKSKSLPCCSSIKFSYL